MPKAKPKKRARRAATSPQYLKPGQTQIELAKAMIFLRTKGKLRARAEQILLEALAPVEAPTTVTFTGGTGVATTVWSPSQPVYYSSSASKPQKDDF